MADNVTVANAGDPYEVSSDEAASGQVQRMKLAQSADGSDTHVQADSDGLLVNLGTNNDVTVTGTITADLGAVDNAVLDDIAADTEAIKTAVETLDNAIAGTEMQVDVVGALPAGNNNIGDVDVASVTGNVTVVQGTAANLNVTEASGATIAASLSVVDDWDETDRAKVNIIAGQAGVAAGAGAVGTTTQRTTLASDDPAVTALQIMDDWDESDRAKVNPIVGQAGVAGNTGTVGATTQRVTLATDVALPTGSNAIGKLAANSGVDIGDVDVTSIVPGTGATNLGKAEDAQHTTGDTGVMALGVRAAAPTERSAGPSDGDYEPFATNEVGAIWVTQTPSANGGASVMNASSSDGATALTNSAQAIKASAGTLMGYYIYNPNSSAQFVQFYNTASGSVTVGTTNPLFMLTIPATSAANLSQMNIAFSTAISWAATSTAGGNGAPTTALDAVAWYK